MRPSRIVLLLVALGAGGLAAYLATRGGDPVQVVEGPTQVIEEAKTQILVAVAPIGVGQRLSPATVQWADWPEGAVRQGYITATAMPDALDHLNGAVSRFEIFPGDPILEAKLVRSDQGYLSAVLAAGKRGVSIAVNADSASGGFIVPNDRVDVVLTRPGGSGQISETILSNVKVLAIGARLGETGSTGAPEDPDAPQVFTDKAIATLELDPVQGETVINASKVGTLSLALRSIADFHGRDVGVRRTAKQAVRVIRFGAESNVMAGATGASEAQPQTVEEASYAPPILAPGLPAPVQGLPAMAGAPATAAAAGEAAEPVPVRQ